MKNAISLKKHPHQSLPGLLRPARKTPLNDNRRPFFNTLIKHSLIMGGVMAGVAILQTLL